jgi:hypothetical protein
MGLVVQDLDGNGSLDALVANAVSSTVSFFAGSPGGALGARHDFSVGDNPNILSVADWNADGAPDVLVPNELSGTVTLLTGSQRASYVSQVALPPRKGHMRSVRAT